MSRSNGSIGADAPAAAFGKTAFADFASVRDKFESDIDMLLSNDSIGFVSARYKKRTRMGFSGAGNDAENEGRSGGVF